MKKAILILGIFCSTVSFSQLHSVGFHLGAMGTSMGGKFDNGDARIKIDFLGGINYNIRFSNSLTLGANIEYAQMGARVLHEFYNYQGIKEGESWSSWDWNYISIPMTVGFEMGGKFRFKPKAGITPSILARCIYNQIPFEGTSLSHEKFSNYSNARKLDLGGIAGFDVSVPFNAGVFFLGVDFRYSITKVNTDNLFNETLFDAYRHRGVSSVLGLRFNLGNPHEDEGPTDIIDDPLD